MKNMFRYLLRSKHGILTTIRWTGGSLAVCALILGLITGMNYWIYIRLEEMSLIAAVIGFVFVCSNAFRFGTANSVSRSTVIKTLLLSVFLMSAMQSAVNTCMLVLRGLATKGSNPLYHWSWDLLYIEFNNSAKAGREEDMRVLDALVPKLLFWESLLYFGIICLLLTLCCFLFALYRKYGFAGLLGGIAVPALLASAFKLYIMESDIWSKWLRDVYYHKDWVQLTQYAVTEQPKAVPFITTFAVLIMVTAAGFAICMKHTDIRKKA